MSDDKCKTTTITDFADRLSWDCIHNGCSSSIGNAYLGAGIPSSVEVTNEDGSSSLLSPMSTGSSFSQVLLEHKLVDTTEVEGQPDPKTGNRRLKRRICRSKGCKTKTKNMCDHHDCRMLCINVNGRDVYGSFWCVEHWNEHLDEVSRRGNA